MTFFSDIPLPEPYLRWNCDIISGCQATTDMPSVFYFWTTDRTGEIIDKRVWHQVGVAFYAPRSKAGSTLPIKRAFTREFLAHFWTDDYKELSTLRVPDFVEEPQNFYDVYPTSTIDRPEMINLVRLVVRVPQQRNTHPPDQHFWTIHPDEQPSLPHGKYVFDRNVGKVFKSPVEDTVPVYLWTRPPFGQWPHPTPPYDPLVVHP